MYYITNGQSEYYAGQDYSNPNIPAWKTHHSRGLPFGTQEAALAYVKGINIKYLAISYIWED